MQAKTVSISELTADNPTLCLSALRVFDRCHECPIYKKKKDKSKLKCKPHLNKDAMAQLDRKAELKKELKDIENSLKS